VQIGNVQIGDVPIADALIGDAPTKDASSRTPLDAPDPGRLVEVASSSPPRGRLFDDAPMRRRHRRLVIDRAP